MRPGRYKPLQAAVIVAIVVMMMVFVSCGKSKSEDKISQTIGGNSQLVTDANSDANADTGSEYIDTDSDANKEADSNADIDIDLDIDTETDTDIAPDTEANKASDSGSGAEDEAKADVETIADDKTISDDAAPKDDKATADNKAASDDKASADNKAAADDKAATDDKAAADDKTGDSESAEGKENDASETGIKGIVAIDAGHQRKGNYEQEPVGPGAKSTKAKVSSGTQGRFTGVPEYELNLVIAKMVRDKLLDRGYEVVMIRESHDVNLSNKERADIANESGADIFIRIHANGSTNPSVHGSSTIYPSSKNPYVADLSDASYKLSKAIVDSLCKSTGSKNLGAVARDDMSGINWSKIPVTIIEMGYMTNEKEDKLMQTEDYQEKIAEGICKGIDKYFGY